MVEPGRLVTTTAVAVLVGFMTVGVTCVADGGRGVEVGMEVGVGICVETGSAGTVPVTPGVGVRVRYGS